MKEKTANKETVLEFFRALNQAETKADIFSRYTTDPLLIGQFLLLESLFPHFRILVDEVIAEDQRVIVRGRINGESQIPFAMGYCLHRGKIIDHWMISDTIF